MANITCPKCSQSFDSSDPRQYVGRKEATVAGGVAGGYAGSFFGLAGFFGAIAGTLPCAVVGATVGYLTVSNFRRCPGRKCGHVFKI